MLDNKVSRWCNDSSVIMSICAIRLHEACVFSVNCVRLYVAEAARRP